MLAHPAVRIPMAANVRSHCQRMSASDPERSVAILPRLTARISE
jgi:hypothetical protein